jgi:hypothetical protein
VPPTIKLGLDETLTVLRLAVPPTLARTLRSTNTLRVDCVGVSRTRRQRQTLAGREDGAALVCGWPGRPASSSAASTVICTYPSLRAALEGEFAEPVGVSAA